MTNSLLLPVDNKYIFANYSDKYWSHKLANIPKIIGTTSREASALNAYPVHNLTAGPWEAGVVQATTRTTCLAYNTSVIREQVGGLAPTWRYQWAGNFTNISPLWWLGAYHYSDLYMFFGSYPIAPGPVSDLEVRTAHAMQDYLLAFVRDPYSGLPDAGYPEFLPLNGTDGGTIARFGADGKPSQLVPGNDVDGVCHIPGATFDTAP